MTSERYDRQLRMAELGPAGQQKLSQSRVLVVGAGGLGSPALFYLAAAGVGTIGVADGDVVALSNLNRQILHRTADIDVEKVASAERAIADLNPEVQVQTYGERLDVDRAAELAAQYDLLVDAADSFVSKYLLNDAAVRAGTPLLHAGVEGLAGQLALLGLPGGPCLRCVYPDAPADPAEPRAILGATAGVLGALQAAEAIQFLAGIDAPRGGKLLAVDLRSLQFRAIKISRDPDCPVCH
jgi:molybdopterin/thiamine biosynthesis adenylyltransferase